MNRKPFFPQPIVWTCRRRQAIGCLLMTAAILLIPALSSSQEQVTSRRKQAWPAKVPTEVNAKHDFSARLINQLGDDDFVRREQAETELHRLGAVALPALSEIVAADSQSIDTEVRMRVQRLLTLIRREDFEARKESFLNAANDPLESRNEFGFSGWNLFADIVGNSKSSREMFMGMVRANEELFLAIGRGTNTVAAKFQVEYGRAFRSSGGVGQMVDVINGLMFFSAIENTENQSNRMASVHPVVELNTVQFKAVCGRLVRPDVVTFVQNSRQREQIEALIDYWLTQSGSLDSTRVNSRLAVIKEYHLRGQMEFLLARLPKSELPVQSRVQALESILRLNDASVVEKLQPLLTDEAVVGRFQIHGSPSAAASATSPQWLETQYRDLVLATCVQLANLSLAEFGFVAIVALREEDSEAADSSKKSLDRGRLGFIDENARERSLAEWRAFYLKQR